MTWLAMRGIERRTTFAGRAAPSRHACAEGLREIWSEPRARSFTLFVFLSMTAYFMQELILEPYAGLVFGFSPGESTRSPARRTPASCSAWLTVGLAASALGLGTLRFWVSAGCLLSAAALVLIALLGQRRRAVAAEPGGRPARLRQRHLCRRRHRRR